MPAVQATSLSLLNTGSLAGHTAAQHVLVGAMSWHCAGWAGNVLEACYFPVQVDPNNPSIVGLKPRLVDYVNCDDGIYIHTYIHTLITLHYIALHYITLHTYIHIYIYIHIYTYTYIHIYIYMYIYIHIYIYIYTLIAVLSPPSLHF